MNEEIVGLFRCSEFILIFVKFSAPPAFKVKPRKSRQIDSRSPFSSERKFNLPKGSGFQVKKSEKKLTEFHEFKQNEGNWKVGSL